MSDTLESLRRKIDRAGELKSVVRTMKALAALSIGQYEKAVRALSDYYRTVELGLVVCLRDAVEPRPAAGRERQDDQVNGSVGIIVFGSDQGLVGQFNEVLSDFTVKSLATIPGRKRVWAVGERMHARLNDAPLPVEGLFDVPNSVSGICPLIGQILTASESHHSADGVTHLHIFHNRPISGAIYKPFCQRLLPLDETWLRKFAGMPWPTKCIPETMNARDITLRALIREYLFVSLFQACAESLASENASRLAAMQRAEKNIGELLEDLTRRFHQLRQDSIDAELFDVVSGFEALTVPQHRPDK